ncbi:unnamed protein product [Chilo suppressalis]|uniref:CHK kinase-like domain-containing protein n=1 Tax=Chilo suppressalis TaxID=168631 RepID=A0ABN8AV84_CHISP|nr:unnamed protein product [Chilo suppressalis]
MPHRKISRASPELINIIHKVSATCNITNFEHVIHFGSDDVDSNTDGYYKVSLKGYRDGQRVRWNYIIKWHCDPKRRSLFREAYKREVLFFNKIVPSYLEIQRSFRLIEGLKIKFPNCYYASAEWNEEVLVFASPYAQGFRLHDRLATLGLDHVSLVMKNLAKLHALSFVFEKYQPVEFEEIRKACSNDLQYSDVKLIPKSMITYYDASVNVVKDEKAKKLLKHYASYILQILNKSAMPIRRKHLVICHGDCWNNNVMYKFQKENPVDIMFIDNQLTRYASPVTDLSYYLYMSTDQQFLSAHYDRMVNLYYNNLSAILRQFNLEPNDFYPEHVFLQDLKDYSVLGLIEALVSMKIITALPEEAIKMAGLKYGDDYSEDGTYCNEDQTCNSYVERVNGVVNDFFNRKYSLDALI